MDIFIPIFIFFIIFVLCSLCGVCCKKKEEGAIFSTPVVITSQTHQPVGSSSPYPVYSGTGVAQSSYQTVVVSSSMLMPYGNNSSPYPPQQPFAGAPYSAQAAPYPPSSAPFLAQSGPYPPSSAPYAAQAAPYPPQHTMDPPAYNEVVANQNYQKQAPYNPQYNG